MNDDERQKLLEQMEADEKAMRAFEDAVIKMALYASEIAPLFQKHGDEKRKKAFGTTQDCLSTASTAIRKGTP